MAIATQTFKNFIDGESVDAAEGGTDAVFNPATGEELAQAPSSTQGVGPTFDPKRHRGRPARLSSVPGRETPQRAGSITDNVLGNCSSAQTPGSSTTMRQPCGRARSARSAPPWRSTMRRA